MLCRGVKEPGSSPARKESKQKEEKVAAVDKGAAEKEKVAKERSRSKSGEEDICFNFCTLRHDEYQVEAASGV